MAIVALAVIAAAALVIVTTVLQRTTSSAVNAAESLRFAQHTKVALLLHEQTTDPARRSDLVAEMRRDLDDAQHFVSSATEARLLADARGKLTSFSGDGRELDLHRAALNSALDALVKLNTAQARQAEARASRWDEVANISGTVIALLLLVLSVALIVWLRRYVFAPMLALAAMIKRFESDRDVRAVEGGPAELRDISRQFNEMASALRAQRKAQVAYLAGVAHDLRNPLSILQMTVDAVDPSAPLPPEDRMRMLIERFQKQTRRLNRMIEDFLEISRIEAGQLALSIDEHDLREVVRDVVALFEETGRPTRIVVALPAEPVRVACDRGRIEQVLTNLVSNALKYSSPATQIDVGAEAREHDVVLTVTDRGCGMSNGDKASLFEAFRRGRLAKDGAPGAGLGLSVVRRIVQAHRGRIEVDSDPGAGSTFRVYLPVQR